VNAALKFDAVHEALLSRGFKQAATRERLTYLGDVEVGNERVAVSLDFPDLELQHLPRVRLTMRPSWIPEVCNHVIAENTLCYAVSKLAFIDRYDAARQVLYCLDKAAEVLRDIKHGNVLGDVDQEFASYWRGQPLLIDADADRHVHSLNVLTLRLPGRELALACGASSDAINKYAAYAPTETKLSAAIVLPMERTPPADTKIWPPRTLQQLTRWLSAAAPSSLAEWRRSLGGLNGQHVRRALFVFQSSPTWFGFGFAFPADATLVRFRHEKDFINAILSRSEHIEVERYTPLRIDSEYLVTRNLRDDEKALPGKRILLVGCGTIGSHLTHALARAGAGFGGGSIGMVDPDIFTAGNVGRHRLGLEALLLDKADALAQDLRRSLPGVDARPIVGSALDLDLKGYDLLVDATGEEQLSDALNARFIAGSCAPVIFVWINGNGTSVQSFTLVDRTQGCLRCWKSHGNRTDFVPSDDTALEVRMGRGCDDPYTPFSGAAPLTASGLALQAVLDWASGRPMPTLRAIELDYRKTHHVKPKSPVKSAVCPACRQVP